MSARLRPSERDVQRHIARVYLAEARRRKGQDFAATLLQWAKNARNRSNAIKPAQYDIFGGRS